MVERSLTAECGSAVITQGFVTPANRAALSEIVRNDHEPMDRRGRAVYLLGMWPDDETVATLVEVVDELDEAGRSAAASGIGRVKTRAGMSALEHLAGDPSPDVRRVAINGLGAAGTPEATAVLRRVRENDTSEINRARALDLLG